MIDFTQPFNIVSQFYGRYYDNGIIKTHHTTKSNFNIIDKIEEMPFILKAIKIYTCS